MAKLTNSERDYWSDELTAVANKKIADYLHSTDGTKAFQRAKSASAEEICCKFDVTDQYIAFRDLDDELARCKAQLEAVENKRSALSAIIYWRMITVQPDLANYLHDGIGTISNLTNQAWPDKMPEEYHSLKNLPSIIRRKLMTATTNELLIGAVNELAKLLNIKL